MSEKDHWTRRGLLKGIGSIAGAAMGMVLLSTVEQGLVLMGVPLEGFGMMVGAIIIVSGLVNKYVAGQD